MEDHKNNNNESSRKKKTMGRRKVEMKRIEKKSSLQVTFTKRRMGLFRKASEMSILCGSEMAILVQSPANKVFAFGNESILDRFHRRQTSPLDLGFVTSSCESDNNSDRKKYDDAVRKLEEEKKRMMESTKIMEKGYWWDANIDDENMELHQLEEFVEALEGLRINVDDKITNDHKQKHKVIDVEDFSSSNLLLANLENNKNGNNDEDGATEFNYTDLLQLEDYFGGEQYCSDDVDDMLNAVQAPTHDDQQYISSNADAYIPATSSSSPEVPCNNKKNSSSSSEVCNNYNNNNNSSSSDYNFNHPEEGDVSIFEELDQYMKTNPVLDFGFFTW